MNIGQASERSGISPKMIRYYEQIGLLDTAKRSNSGYRIYSNQDIKNLCFLRYYRPAAVTGGRGAGNALRGIISLRSEV